MESRGSQGLSWGRTTAHNDICHRDEFRYSIQKTRIAVFGMTGVAGAYGLVGAGIGA